MNLILKTNDSALIELQKVTYCSFCTRKMDVTVSNVPSRSDPIARICKPCAVAIAALLEENEVLPDQVDQEAEPVEPDDEGIPF